MKSADPSPKPEGAWTGNVPDFDSYPVVHRITAAQPMRRGVRVVWSDGLDARYHVHWLRENAPDPDTTHPVTREQSLQLADIPADLEANEK